MAATTKKAAAIVDQTLQVGVRGPTVPVDVGTCREAVWVGCEWRVGGCLGAWFAWLYVQCWARLGIWMGLPVLKQVVNEILSGFFLWDVGGERLGKAEPRGLHGLRMRPARLPGTEPTPGPVRLHNHRQ